MRLQWQQWAIFAVWKSFCLPGCALGTDPNVLGLKMTNLSSAPVSPPLTGFSKPVLLLWQSVTLSLSPYVSGYSLAFLQAVAAKTIPCYTTPPPPKRLCVPGPPCCSASWMLALVRRGDS